MFQKLEGFIMNKMLLAQLGIITLVWIGMAFFFSDMSNTSKIIFYIVTSWFLFLIVIVIKDFLRTRKEKTE